MYDLWQKKVEYVLNLTRINLRPLASLYSPLPRHLRRPGSCPGLPITI